MATVGHETDADSDISFNVDLELGDAIEHSFDRNKNEVLRNWIRISHMVDGMEDNVLAMAMKPIINLFGGFRVLLKDLISQSSDTNQLNTLYTLLKKTHNEHAKPPNQDTPSNPTPFTLNELPSELLSYVCGYLQRHDIDHFKVVSWTIAVVGLEEMSKIPITMFHADSLINHRHHHQHSDDTNNNTSSSMLWFREIHDYRECQIRGIKEKIKRLKDKKLDLDFYDGTTSDNKVDSKSNNLDIDSDDISIEKWRKEVISEIKRQKQMLREITSTKLSHLWIPSRGMICHRMVLGTTLHDVFQRFANRQKIPFDQLLIYHFRTPSPLDLFGSRNTDTMESEVELTNQCYRKFIVFDQRQILYVNTSQTTSINPWNGINGTKGTNPMLNVQSVDYRRCKVVFLKYFDIDTQTLQFVGHLLIEPNVTVRDLSHFIEYRFVSDLCRRQRVLTKQSERCQQILDTDLWYIRLQDQLQKMKTDAISSKLSLYRPCWMDHDEQSNFSMAIGNRRRYLVNALEVIGDLIHNGEILIFQLNPFNSSCHASSVSVTSIFSKNFSKNSESSHSPKFKWYKKVSEYIRDTFYKRLNPIPIAIRSTGVSVRYQSRDHKELDTDHILHYLKHHRQINNEQQRRKILHRIQNCVRFLKLDIAPCYTFGDFRKQISNAMDNAIEPHQIHLFHTEVTGQLQSKYDRHLPWSEQWGTQSIHCRWDIVSFDTSDDHYDITTDTTSDSQYCSVMVHKLKGYYVQKGQDLVSGKAITLKVSRNLSVKETVDHILNSMQHPLMEYKCRDIICGFSWEQFKVVLCIEVERGKSKILQAMELDQEWNYWNPLSDRDVILPMHLLMIRKMEREQAADDEVVLYLRFMLSSQSSTTGSIEYENVCCGLPVPIVIKKEDSLQDIIDSGKLTKFDVSQVFACYHIHHTGNHASNAGDGTKSTTKQIRRKTVQSGKTWNHYQPYMKCLKEHPADQILLKVDNVNIATFGGKCIVGDSLFG